MTKYLDTNNPIAIENAINPSFAGKEKHVGMPPFDPSGPAISWFEFMTGRLFYIPIVIKSAWWSLKYGGITLPCLANPNFPLGGWVGESKAEVLSQVGGESRNFVAKFAKLSRSADIETDMRNAEEYIKNAGLTFPLISKPDMGCRGVGVQISRSMEHLQKYCESFPIGADILLQELIPFEGEAGVFYIKMPHEKSGQIFSLTLKYFPFVVGDGKSTLEELIMGDYRAKEIHHVYRLRHAHRLQEVIPLGQNFRLAFTGSHSRGTIFRNGAAYITKGMLEAFDKIAADTPEFYFGRFDIRFQDYRDLQQGHGFKIVEINGAGGEATHIWDRKTTILEAWRTLLAQYHYLYKIGAMNKKRGFKLPSLRALIDAWQKEKHTVLNYPYTE